MSHQVYGLWTVVAIARPQPGSTGSLRLAEGSASPTETNSTRGNLAESLTVGGTEGTSGFLGSRFEVQRLISGPTRSTSAVGTQGPSLRTWALSPYSGVMPGLVSWFWQFAIFVRVHLQSAPGGGA